MIRLNVFIEVSTDKRATVIEIAKELVNFSLDDAGCIAYDLYESATRHNTLMICETWKDAKALEAHEKSAHFTSLVPLLEAMSNMKLEKFEF